MNVKNYEMSRMINKSATYVDKYIKNVLPLLLPFLVDEVKCDTKVRIHASTCPVICCKGHTTSPSDFSSDLVFNSILNLIMEEC